jgi:phenylcoumaran benzylic ether reductase
MPRTLIVGATGHLGRQLVDAARHRGDEVHVLLRPATRRDPEKMKTFATGVVIHEGDLSDRDSLVRACRAVDGVISAVGSMQVGEQHALVDAVRDAGVKRFIPSDFGLDPAAAARGSCLLFDLKAGIGEAVKRAGIPYTFIHSNGFFTHWVLSLGDLTRLGGVLPPAEVNVYGGGEVKGAFTSELDIAAVTVRALHDPALAGRELRLAPNLTTQEELIRTWERKSGRSVKRVAVGANELERTIAGATAPEQGMLLVLSQLHRSMWIGGEGTKKGPVALEVSEVYPDVRFRTIEEAFAAMD